MADTPVKIPSKYDKAIATHFARQVDPFKTACFDSSLFCAKLNEEICGWIKRYEVFDWLWNQAKNGEFEIRISALTIAEVHHIKRIAGGEIKKIGPPLYDDFLKLIAEGRRGGFLTVMDISEKTATRAHSLCGELDILPNDALIVANAIEFECDVVLAWDPPLTKKTTKDIRLEEPFIFKRDLYNSTIEQATEDEQRLYYESRHPQKTEPVEVPVESDIRGSDGGNGKSEAGVAVGSDGEGSNQPEEEAKPERVVEIEEVIEQVKRPEM